MTYLRLQGMKLCPLGEPASSVLDRRHSRRLATVRRQRSFAIARSSFADHDRGSIPSPRYGSDQLRRLAGPHDEIRPAVPVLGFCTKELSCVRSARLAQENAPIRLSRTLIQAVGDGADVAQPAGEFCK